ncbi:MAG: GAF domain-containing sensor histidine kinase [Anaerolineae bacterium]|nr:GAF domain-containing sensor histidine kinase [Anaerolineae bacterium]
MKTKPLNLDRRDWTLFGLRWLLLILASLTLHFISLQPADEPVTFDIISAVLFGILANIVFLIFAFIPMLEFVVPVVVILGDWLMAAAFVGTVGNNPLFMVGFTGALMFSSLFYLGPFWGFLQSTGVIVVALLSLSMPFDPVQFNALLNELSIPLLLIASMGLVGLGWALSNDLQTHADEQAKADLTLKSVMLLNEMRDRTRAISEMSATLSRTLNFDRVLEAALDAGRVGLRSNSDKRVISAAFLFNDRGELHMSTSRGMSRSDESRVLPGKKGLVGKALTECVPVFGKDARKDTELQYLVAFQSMRSVMCIPLRAGYENFGILLYGSESPDAFTEDHIDLLKAISTQATIALQNASLYRSLLEEKERIVDVEEDARKKLARDLHDGPTQNVSAIAMRMSYIYRLLERKPEDVPAELKKVEELARKTTREIRHMLFTLRPLVLENQGLEAALNQLSEKMQETHGQAVAINVDRRVETTLDNHQQGVLFYIIEEATGNARKHAEAELISVNVFIRQDAVVAEIADNGVGFNTGAVDANYDQRGSLGMINMRERTALLDGVLHIASAEGKGTTITVMVPLRSAQDSTEMRRQRVNNRVPGRVALNK